MVDSCLSWSRPLYEASLETLKRFKGDFSRRSVNSFTSSANPDIILVSFYVLLQDLLEAYAATEGKFHENFAISDLISVWLTKAILLTNVSSDNNELRRCVDGCTVDLLCSFITDGQYTNGPIQNVLKEVLQKAVRLEAILYSRETVKWQQERLLRTLLGKNPLHKTIYNAIAVVLKMNEPDLLEHVDPEFFSYRILHMGDASIATPLSKVLVSVTLAKLQCKASEEDQLSWLRLWQNPVLKAICSEDSDLSSNVITYVVPPLFQASRISFSTFIRALAVLHDRFRSDLMQKIIDCLRKAKELQLIEHIDTRFLDSLCLPADQLTMLLDSPISSLRISALDLLVSHPKPTTKFLVANYSLLQTTLPGFFAETSADARKDFINVMRRFLLRFQASIHNVGSHLKPVATYQDGEIEADAGSSYHKHSRLFATWLIDLLKRNLEPGTGYQVAHTTLQVMQLATGLGWNDLESQVVSNSISAFPGASCSKGFLASNLPFKVKLFDAEMVRLLLDRLVDPFDDNRILVMSLLNALPSDISESVSETVLRTNARTLLLCTRGRDADGGARVAEYVFKRFVLSHRAKGTSEPSDEKEVWVPPAQHISQAVDDILLDINRVDSSILLLAANSPFHGRISAIRCMLVALKDIKLCKIITVSISTLKALHAKIIDMCEHIWLLVRDILCDDSPEGNLPISPDDRQDATTRAQSSQLVLSFSWRSIREASHLLCTVFSKLPGATMPAYELVDCKRAGKLFLSWLTDIRHRGAFSAVCPDLVMFSRALLDADSHGPISDLPKIWLTDMLSELESPDHNKDITRRSGGLPMSVISLLVSEVVAKRPEPPMTSYTMRFLIDLSRRPSNTDDDVDGSIHLPQVHAMNTLKDIFLDSRLSLCCTPYLEECFSFTIAGFSSSLWPIRNSSLMLFSALLRRSFGGKIFRQDTETNTFTFRAFTQQYPSLLSQIVIRVRTAMIEHSQSGLVTLNTGLHAYLTMLALFDSTAADTWTQAESELVDELVNLLHLCAASRVWQIRTMAAEAVPPFIKRGGLFTSLSTLVKTITTSDQNVMHGRLCQILSILNYHLQKRTGDLEFVGELIVFVSQLFNDHFEVVISRNTCCITKALVLNIWSLFLSDSRAGFSSSGALHQKILSFCASEIFQSSNQGDTPGASELSAGAIIVILDDLATLKSFTQESEAKSTTLVRLINHPRQDIRVQVYDFIAGNPGWTLLLDDLVVQTLLRQHRQEISIEVKIAARRAVAVLNLCHVRESLLKDVLSLPEHLSELEELNDSSPLIEPTLVLIGRLMSVLVPATEDLRRFATITLRFSGEHLHLSLRRAVLEGLKLSHASRCILSCSNSNILVILARTILRLLVDDDEDLRQMTAEYTCQSILSCSTKTAANTKVLLMDELAKRYEDDLSFQALLLEYIIGKVEPTLQFEQVVNRSEELFAIESPNLWRNELESARDAISVMESIKIEASIIDALSTWASTVLKIFNEHLRQHEDGPLGWSSALGMWQLLNRAVATGNFVLARSDKKNEQVVTMQKCILDMRNEGIKRNLHERVLKSLPLDLGRA